MGDEVKVEVKPSVELTTPQEAQITDSRARVIKLRKPGALAQYRLVEAMGDSAANRTYMGMVLPLIYVTSIDGEPVTVRSKAQVEALIQRLDDEGIKAVMEGVEANFGSPDPEKDKATLKN